MKTFKLYFDFVHVLKALEAGAHRPHCFLYLCEQGITTEAISEGNGGKEESSTSFLDLIAGGSFFNSPLRLSSGRLGFCFRLGYFGEGENCSHLVLWS